MIYTVTFNPAIDLVVHTGALKPGCVNRSKHEQLFFGGKGINVSAVLSELGKPSIALGFVAGFTGEAIEKGVKTMGISADFVRLNSGSSRINVKIKAEEETELNCQGPDIDKQALDELFQKLDKLKDGDTLILAGSIPSSLPDDVYERILERLSEKKIMTVVDAAGKLLLNVLKYKPFLIKPNDIELSDIFGVKLQSIEDIENSARKLRQMGAVNVLVSMAEKGALLVDSEDKSHFCKACSGTVVNSVGAGDSMLAGFIAGLDGGYDYALKLGTAAGGATAFSEGLAVKENISRLMKKL